jgi:hypothetical protein
MYIYIHAQACLAPRVWVWGVWLGFALRCVALLCGVFVRLHLALFPAGGPFLPSLFVNLYMHPPSSRGRSGSSALPCAAVTRLWAGPACATSLGGLAGPRCSPLLSLGRNGLRLCAVACLPVALADLCECVWGLSRVSVSCVACVCLCLASALCLSAPMLLGVSFVPLCSNIYIYIYIYI